MDGIVLILGLSLHLGLVLTPSVIAGLALQRVTASRSRNRLLYAGVALVSGYLALRLLADIMAGLTIAPLPALAALGTLPGWGLILWVVSGPGTGQYPARTDWRLLGALPPLMLTEAVRVEPWQATGNRAEATASRVNTRATGPERASPTRTAAVPEVVVAPTFRTRQQVPPEPRWRPAQPLAFVPKAGGLR